MNFIAILQKVIDSNVLIKELTVVPQNGASNEEIIKEEPFLSRSLSVQHKELLKKWNGINLDVIRFYGCGLEKAGIGSLRNSQKLTPSIIQKGIIIGSDPAGFIYIEDEKGSIYSLDTDGGEVLRIASSLEDFICNYLFGKRAKDFGGESWEEELRENGLIS